MLIIPYSTALTLARPAYGCYMAVAICALVYTLQLAAPITDSLMYYPDSWNPLNMVTSAFAHAGFWHLFGNLVFFMAFAPALEILIASSLRFAALILFLALVTGLAYSLSIVVSGSEAVPTLGFSGVVTGMIGLSAYLMPHARVRVLCWLILLWKTFFVPAWVLAAIYIGLDAWTLLGADEHGGVNLVAHVFGGIGGYVFGLLWLKERREETSAELADEIEAMRVEQRFGKTRAEAHRYRRQTAPLIEQREREREHDRFMGRIYQMVKTHRDSEAIVELLDRYDLQALFTELEMVFERAREWGPSRTLLCLGRLLIQLLDQEQRHGRVLMTIERCQAASPQFQLPDVSRTLFYAQMAIDTGKAGVAAQLLVNAAERYGGLVNHQQCNHLLQKISRPDAARAARPL
ncbi:MAG: rhomboid family intramembrane serine protease [Gammaproteobacteria bacterium]|nr:rhomboid family intramembrane serine protease [Gammaproteobacteria bacterium]MDH3537115.1 rhomboid family intramembrane serine protease [Gammaproteobacteria bacterium]